MREDLTIKNRNYRIIVDPVSVTNPESPRMAVFFRNPAGKLELVREVKEGETEDELLQEGRTLAEHHANNF